MRQKLVQNANLPREYQLRLANPASALVHTYQPTPA